MGKARKLRLDELLAQRGLADSRAQARLLILAGKVRSGTQVLDKPGKDYPEDLPLELVQAPRFVSRGGEKLQGFLDAHPIPLEGVRALDVGASTGGFTDCLLQHGATHVTCVDVGRAQLHGKLLREPRITNLEGVNARSLDPSILPHPSYDVIVMDLSFISLTAVLPAVWTLLRAGGHLICLIKPQFEVGKEDADRHRGVIRDATLRQQSVAKIRSFASAQLARSQEVGLVESPIQGAEGNVEYLLGLRRCN